MNDIPAGYVSIRVSTLRPGSPLPMDVFLPVRGRSVRFAASGIVFEGDQLEKLRAYRLNRLMIRESDEGKYRGFLGELLHAAETSATMSLQERSDVMCAGTEGAAQDVYERPTDRTVYMRSQTQFERYGRFLKAYSNGAARIVMQAGKMPADYLSHCLQVATLSVMLAERMGLLRDPFRRTALITGALMHDIGLEAANVEFTDHTAMAKEQLEIWAKHSQEGARILGSQEYVDRQVIDVVLQHEELPNGQGIPRGLGRVAMDPLALVVSLANRFDHHCLRVSGNKERAIKEFYADNVGVFDLDLLNPLRDLLAELSRQATS